MSLKFNKTDQSSTFTGNLTMNDISNTKLVSSFSENEITLEQNVEYNQDEFLISGIADFTTSGSHLFTSTTLNDELDVDEDITFAQDVNLFGTCSINRTTTDQLSIFGDGLTGTGKYLGGVLAQNGKIYGMSYSSTDILEINTTEKTYLQIPRATVDAGNTLYYAGAVLGKNGKIYGIPHSAYKALEFDPTDGTSSLVPNEGDDFTGRYDWFGGVLANDGNIYGIPFNTYAGVLKIDFSTGSPISSVVGPDPGQLTQKWIGGVLAPNGKIYFVPFSSVTCIYFDPLFPDTPWSNISAGSDTQKWAGGALGPDGLIYFVPYSATTVGIVDPDTNILTSIGLRNIPLPSGGGNYVPGNNQWAGCVLALDGKIYCAPVNAEYILVIIPKGNSSPGLELIPLGSFKVDANSTWAGINLGLDGQMYCIPGSVNDQTASTNILQISDITAGACPSYLFGAVRNKL